ncbi:hypothetical protein ACOMHN_056242 [Nucella lapillus]
MLSPLASDQSEGVEKDPSSPKKMQRPKRSYKNLEFKSLHELPAWGIRDSDTTPAVSGHNASCEWSQRQL